MTKTIGILTGGGDVPGLNPAIKSVAMSAFDAGYKWWEFAVVGVGCCNTILMSHQRMITMSGT